MKMVILISGVASVDEFLKWQAGIRYLTEGKTYSQQRALRNYLTGNHRRINKLHLTME